MSSHVWVCPNAQFKPTDATPPIQTSTDLTYQAPCMRTCTEACKHACIRMPACTESHSKTRCSFLILIDDSVYLWNNNSLIPPSTLSPASPSPPRSPPIPLPIVPPHQYENDIRNKMRFEILCLTSRLMKGFHSWA